MRAAIIINPFARRNRNGLLAVLRKAAEDSQIRIFQIDDFKALGKIIDQIHDFAPEILIVSGGDGAAHAVISMLGEDPRFSPPPLLVLMPHGTTNVTAKDISLKSAAPNQLAKIMQLTKTPCLNDHIITRRSIRVANLVGRPPLHGFIFCTGTLERLTKKCQTGPNASGWSGNTAVAISLAGDFIRKLFGTDPTLGGVLETLDMELKTNSGKCWQGQSLTLLATTLNALVLGAKPFWNQGAEPIHITRVGGVPAHFFKNLYRIFYGNKAKLPADFFQSFSDTGFDLKINSNILIDGEFYTASAQTPLEISTGPAFKFLKI